MFRDFVPTQPPDGQKKLWETAIEIKKRLLRWASYAARVHGNEQPATRETASKPSFALSLLRREGPGGTLKPSRLIARRADAGKPGKNVSP